MRPRAALALAVTALGLLAPPASAVDGVDLRWWAGDLDTSAQAGCAGGVSQNDPKSLEIEDDPLSFDFSLNSTASGTCPNGATQNPDDQYSVSTTGSGTMEGDAVAHATYAEITATTSTGATWSQSAAFECCAGSGSGDAAPTFRFDVTQEMPYSISATTAGQVPTSNDGGYTDAQVRLDRIFPGEHTTIAIARHRIPGGQPGDQATIASSGKLAPATYELVIDGECGQVTRAVSSQECSASTSVRLVLGNVDTDGDGLLDSWESQGIDFTGNGSIDLDLPAMGADPKRKDVFVEMDFMPPHRLEQAAIDAVVAAFANAPVANPDGSSGITLHVDNGPDSVMNPKTGQTWGSLSDQDELPHQDVLGSEDSPDVYNWSAFDLLKAGNFSVNREPAFHYAPSIHQYPSSPDNNSSGLSRGLGASDFFVSLGRVIAGTDQTFTAAFQAGTFMHELGHNLNLRHGGADDERWKPNYLSVMNYSFQLGWLATTAPSRVLDYSRYAFDLDETSLNEQLGLNLGGTPIASFVTTYYCPDKSAKSVAVIGTVDWNCDGAIAPSAVASNVNKEPGQNALKGHLDWPALVYDGGLVGAGAATPPASTTIDEPSLAELEEAARAMDAYFAGPDPDPTPDPDPQPTDPTGPDESRPAPRLASLALRPAKFLAARGRGASIALASGSRVTYRLTARATVTFRVQRRSSGRFRAVRGSFGHRGKAGRNRFRFTGRLRGRSLGPGRYRLIAKTKRGSSRRARFTVLRPAPR